MVDAQLSEKITTPGQKNVQFKIDGQDDGQAYLTQNSSEFGLILLQEWWGLNQAICRQADSFSEQGFIVLVPDLYRGQVAKNREQAGHLRNGLDWNGAIKYINGAVIFLQSKGCKNIAITGFCMGGAVALAALTQLNNLDAGIPFYGIPDLNIFDVSQIKVPVLAYFGDQDKAVGFSDPESAKKLEQKAKDAKIDFELKLVVGGQHAFMNQDSPNYNQELSKQCIVESSKWLKEKFSQKNKKQ